MEKRVLRAATFCVAAICWLNTNCAQAQLRAFGDAEGFGSLSTGGRAGSLYVVTNLNDSGAGSFRDAVSQSNRIVVFAVGGYVNLLSAVSVKSNITILGQTAPGQGIGFMGHEVSFSTSSNDIVEFIRAREGSADSSAKASINLGDTTNMILDHVDAEYSQYDNIDAVGTNGVNNVTIQNSLLADPIKAQQFNMHTEGNNVTYVNNLWVNAHNRNPLAKSNSQYINNVVYNYQAGYTTGNSAGVYSYDILNNYFIAGPSTTSAGDAWYQLDSNQSAYASGNLLDSNKDGVLNGSATTPSGVNLLSAPWSSTTTSLPLLSASAAYTFDVAHAGDSLQRDTVDTQVISQVQSLGTQGSIYNTENDTGLSNNGFGTITGGTPPTSSANDGIPDTWAAAHGLSTTDPSGALKLNPLGYTMIEQYANELGDEYASQTWSNASGTWSSGTWSSAVPGVFDHALIRGNGSTNGTVTISSGTATAMTLSIGGNGPTTAGGEQVTVSTGGTLSVYDTITVGDQNNATLNISGGTVQAYNIILGDTVYSPSATNYTGTINFTSGTLMVSQIALGAGTPSNWTSGGTMNWSGGTLRAAAQLAINVPISMSGSAGTIDTNGFNGTISGAISGNTAITKIGSGILALTASNNYSGGTILTAGELGISSDANIDGSGSSITFNGGLLQINGTSLVTLNSHVVNWSTFNGGFDIANSANTFTVSQNIGGNGSFTKAGAGTLVLSGMNSYSGGTILTGGVLSVSDDSNLGAVGSPITFAGGTLRITGITFTNLNDHAPTFSASTSTIDVNTAANVFTISQAIGGSGGITKAGAGVLVLSGTNSFTGDTNISAGTLRLGNALALRKSTVNLTTTGIVLDLNGFNATFGGLSGSQGLDLKGTTLSVGANTESYSGVISSSIGTGSIIKNGSGTWSVTSANTYTGSTTLSAGILNIVTIGNGGVAGPLGQSTNAAANLVFDGGTLQFTGTAGVSTDRLFTMTPNGGTIDGSGSSGDGLGFTNTGAIAFTGTGNRALNLIGSETHNAFSPALGDPDASSKTSVIANGTGRWLWESKLSTYSGNTTVQAGTLRLYQGGFLPSGPGKGNVLVSTGATLVADTTTGINALDNGSSGGGTVTVSAGTFTFGNGDASGSFAGAIGGAGGIAKTGAGTEVLSGTDTYSSSTTISGGVLQFNTAASIGGSGASVTVSSGATDAAGYAIDQTFLGRITGTSTGVVALAASSSNNLNLSANGGANLPYISIGAIGSVTYSGVLTPANSAYSFGGGGGTLTVSGINALSGNSTVTVGLGSAAAVNALNLNVTASQSYTGATTIKTGGEISGVVANGGTNSGIGSSSNVASNLILDGGTLAGTGSTNRLFTLTANGGTLDNSGGLSFTNTGALATAASSSPTLTLTGSSTAHNTLSLAVADPSGGTLSVVKSGTGKWTFASGVKTYSGDTHVTAGTLETLSSGALSPNSNMVLDAGTTLDFHDEPSESINALAGAGAVVNSFSGSHTDTLTIGSNNGGGRFTGTITSAGTFNLIKNGAGTEILSGANAFTGTTTINHGTLQLGASNTFPTTANLTLAGGTLTTGGFSDNFGAGKLQVTANSHIDLGSGTSVLHFAASNAIPWSGALTIDDWSGSLSGGGPDQIFVGSDATGLSAYQLANIVFTGSGMPDAVQLATGEVVPGRTLIPGDLTGDNALDAPDVLAMMTALADPAAYESTHDLTATDLVTLGDINQDGYFNNADIQALISDLRSGGGSNATVPEPAASFLAIISTAGGLLFYRAVFRTGNPSRLIVPASETELTNYFIN
ncbi:MAG TPA: autotransporter-associated beta strand repeat-containing protein [Pirellulales bacterium]|nr:autotransporter-associated beta strand repeat-containing protein [Pirellulales bacterium]